MAAALLAFAKDRPVTALDFASLYPSLIMTYNLSPEKILHTPEEAAYWAAQGRSLHAVEFLFNGRVVRGWAVRHRNDPKEIGLYPSVLIDLFNKRLEVKGVLAAPGAVKELIELVFSRAKKDGASIVEAARRILSDAEAQKARTGAALAPEASQPRVSPGSTLAEEVADLKRLNRGAEEQIEGLYRLFALAAPERAEAARLDAAPTAPAPSPEQLADFGAAAREWQAAFAEAKRAPSGDATKRKRLAEAALAEALARALPREPERAGASPERAQSLIATIEAAVKAEFDRASFEWTCANAKQGALKVLMNTFYGESGNALSPYFLLTLAGGVTDAGQYNIKLVAEFVRGKGFAIIYGDTDSLYLVCPARYFAECDRAYVLGRTTREEWWGAMVRITMRAMNGLRDEVSAFLKADNGSSYLKMNYEEVLYPVAFTGKKKYFGVPHLNEVNFRPKKLFVRGIDVVKQGQPGLARDVGYRVMWASVAVDNRRSLRQIDEDVLRDAVANGAQWKFDHFVKTDAWKPLKNNKPVQRFIARMRGRHAAEVAANERAAAAGGARRPYLYELPEAGERFSYVIVKAGASFDLHGHKAALKKGDRMEFAAAARALGLEIDVAFYMVSYVVGLCARFINGDAEFQPAPSARLTEKKADEMAQKAAKRSLEALIKSLGAVDSGALRKRGFAYRRAFGRAAATARGALVERVGSGAAEVLHGEWLDFELLGDGDDEADEGAVTDGTAKTVELLWGAAGALAERVVAGDGDAWNAALGRALGFEANGSDSLPPGAGAPAARAPATRLYAAGSAARGAPRRRPGGASVAAYIASSLDRQEAAVRAEMTSFVPALYDVATRYEADLSLLVDHLRRAEHGAHPEIGAPESPGAEAGAEPVLAGVGEADKQMLLDFRRVWFAAAGIQMTRRRNASFAAYVNRIKGRRIGAPAAPSRAAQGPIIAAAAAKLRTSGDIVSPI